MKHTTNYQDDHAAQKILTDLLELIDPNQHKRISSMFALGWQHGFCKAMNYSNETLQLLNTKKGEH